MFLADVRAMPGGAPSSACASISPQPGHGGSSQLVANSPYSLNVSQLTAAGGYIPGSTYTRMCFGGGGGGRGMSMKMALAKGYIDFSISVIHNSR